MNNRSQEDKHKPKNQRSSTLCHSDHIFVFVFS